MIEVTKFPVLIVANYRTGSTALCEYLAAKYNLKGFPESHYEPEKFDILLSMIESGQTNFIVKFMPEQLAEYKVYQDLLASDCFKIKLSREDKLGQIVSYYIAYETQRWHESANTRPANYTVPINDYDVNGAIERITNNDRLMEELSVKFDEIISYESLGFIEGTEQIKTTLPLNFRFLKQTISGYL